MLTNLIRLTMEFDPSRLPMSLWRKSSSKEINSYDEEKILLVSASSEAVGVSVHVLQLAKLLDSKNRLEAVLCPSNGWLPRHLDENFIEYEVLEISPQPTKFIEASKKLHDQFKCRNTSLIHIHGRFPLFVSILPLVVTDSNFFVTIHQFEDASEPGILGWKNRLESYLLNHFVDGICCVSEPLKEEVIERIGDMRKPKITAIQNWIEPYHYGIGSEAKSSKYDEETPYSLVGVGRLTWEKGFDILIEGVERLHLDGYNINCDIYGDGPLKEKLSTMISEKNLDDVVTLQGVDEEVRSKLPEYEALVLPSRTESFGLVILEAYDAGIPVVASDISGIRQIVEDEVTGLLFEPENHEMLANHVRKFIVSPDINAEFAEQGQSFVTDYYPNEEILNQYLQFYHE